MMRSMYAAVSGLRNHQIRMDVIGNNIANVNTVGFKRDRVNFQDVFYQQLQAPTAPGTVGGTNGQSVGVGVGIGSIDTFHTQGAVMYSGNPLDIMIQGDGYFMLKDGTGTTYYTRAGIFDFDSSGNLVNKSNGFFVLDSSGNKISLTNLAQISSITIGSDGSISYVLNGTPTQHNQKIGLAKFPNPEGLQKVGENLFIESAATGTPTKSTPGTSGLGTLVPGSLEMSNVDLALEFAEMITTQRGFQANVRTITTSDEMLQELVNLKR